MEYLWAFLIGGLFCAVGQILIDYTKLTPARIFLHSAGTSLLWNLQAAGLLCLLPDSVTFWLRE